MLIDLDRLVPNRPEDMDIQVVELGDARYPALIVDGFFRDPDHVRSLALSLRYQNPPGLYPGYWACLSLPLAELVPFLYEHYAHWYYPSAQSMEKQGLSWQFFRNERQREGDPPRPIARRPHVDTGLLVGLVYLNLPSDCRGGTSFFRHKATGAEQLMPAEVFDGRPLMGGPAADPALQDRLWRHGAGEPFERQLAAGHVKDYADYWRQVSQTPGDEHDHIIDSCGGWELTRVVEMKFNRLLLFPGFAIHSTHFRDAWFGHSPETWRLTVNFMFKWPGAPAAS